MSGININLIAAEMKRYVVQNKNVVKADFARALNVPIDAYCKKVTKIQGAYQILNSLMTHVVQGFKPEWKALGEFHVKDKELKNFHQKVNFAFVPASVLGTFLAEWYEEDKKPTDKEIAKRIVEWLMVQITDDVALLSMIGEFDNAYAHGQFGFSIDGFNTLVANLLENSVHPCFKIPLTAITENNVIAMFTKYERGLPKIMKNKIKEIHCSENVAEMYSEAYFNKYGHYPTFGEDKLLKTPLKKRLIVGHDDMDDSIMFSTIGGNMLNLLDINNPATLTDVQTQDYEVKVFGEFWKGWDFLINEAVCVADFVNDVRGLGDDELMSLYYPHEAIVEAIEVVSIAIAPASETTAQDSIVEFSADITPDDAPQGVLWSISEGEGLSIDQQGMVVVGVATPAADYTVTATSIAKGSVTETATLTVTGD